MSGKLEFNWGDDSTVIEQVDAVAVYEGACGHVVIRQRDPIGADDSIIVIPRSYLQALRMALEGV